MLSPNLAVAVTKFLGDVQCVESSSMTYFGVRIALTLLVIRVYFYVSIRTDIDGGLNVETWLYTMTQSII